MSHNVLLDSDNMILVSRRKHLHHFFRVHVSYSYHLLSVAKRRVSRSVSLCVRGTMASEKRREKTKAFRQQYEVNRKIILATQEVCAICGKPVDKTLKPPHPLSPTVDHIIPIAKGGHPCDLDNLQLAHRACNRAKGDKIIGESKTSEENPNRNLPLSRNWKRA